MESSIIASVLDKNKINKAYDYYCKKILSNKQILAHIMKGCVHEFADIPWEEIPKYIESVPETDVVLSDHINGKNLDDESISGALIKYDVLFEAALPKKQEGKEKEVIGLFVNLEAQNKDNPGYPLVSRAIYYCSRLLSKQKNAPDGFQHSDFGKIKKVYSIWICIQHTKEKDDAINVYSFNENCMSKKWNAPIEDYDLMNAVMIYPGRESMQEADLEYKDCTLLEMLKILFISKLNAEDKKMQLNNKYGIIMTKDMEKEVDTMCNLSQGIKEEGIAEGRVEGLAAGTITTTIHHVQNLMHKSGLSAIEAMDMLDVDDDIRLVILQGLQKKNNE